MADVRLEPEARKGSDDSERHREAHDTADGGEEQRLRQQLRLDQPGPGAEGELDADLARSLLDDDVHDVRDADAADDERADADDGEEGAEAAEEHVEEAV